MQHFVSEQSSPGSEHCPGVVVVDVEAEVDPEVDEVVASLAQVGTSNAITQVELAVMASHGIIFIGHRNMTMGSENRANYDRRR